MKVLKEILIGAQTFEKLIRGNHLYIDKTAQIYNLIKTEGTYFLARPRRFGKSLLLSTMQAIFEGKRELFKDLALDKLAYDWEPHPVLFLSMPGLDQLSNAEALKEKLQDILLAFAKEKNILVERGLIDSMLTAIIVALAASGKQNKIVILIDEYDKPLIDSIDDLEKLNQVRSVLKNFYGVLKTADRYIHFLFITGVAQFSKTSIFSDLNHLDDLSLDESASTLLGLTDTEIDLYCADYYDATQEKLGATKSVQEELRVWYDGYKFHQNGELVYNPFSVMNVLKKKEFRRYWFATGTPTFLMKLLEKNLLAFFNDNNAQFYAEDLCLLDPARINFPVLLFQTGYLTLNQFDSEEKTYTLKFPNLEVKSAYNGLIATEIIGRKSEDSSKKELALLRQHITNDDHKEIFKLLKIMCANIPYTIQNPVKQWGTKASETQTHAEQEVIQKEINQKISEQYYQTIFYMIFCFLGLISKLKMQRTSSVSMP